MKQHEHEIENRQLTKRNVAFRWSDSMVRDLLDNDFYIGTLRLRKRARKTIHGKDCRIPREEQYLFENHHPAIIDETTFSLVQELKEKRSRTNYRGSFGQGHVQKFQIHSAVVCSVRIAENVSHRSNARPPGQRTEILYLHHL